MADAPLTVTRRPFAVLPLTNTMLPDGIFDAALGVQRLTCHITNDSAVDLVGVEAYLESVGDPGIAVSAATHVIGTLRAGASVLVSWTLDLSAATPGKKLVSIRLRAQGFTTSRCVQRIFVTRTTYDDATKTFRVQTPEGVLEVTRLRGIGPRTDGWGPDKRECEPTVGPYIPTGMTMRFVPTTPFAGVHGPLLFDDPWWKVAGWIVAAIAALVAIIAAAAGAGTASVSVGGTFEETDPSVNCCEPKVSGEFTVAGVASAIASVAAIVGMADDADPFWRGQDATPPPAAVTTVWEDVDVEFAYPDAPNAGVPYRVDVSWKYSRGLSDGSTMTHEVSEQRTNTHLAERAKVVAPDKVAYTDEALCIEASFDDTSGRLYRGDDLYAVALFVSPAGLTFIEMLDDAGIHPDHAPSDGVYTCCLDLARVYRVHLKQELSMEGWWKIYVFAQDINGATPDQAPEIAAQSIGGYVVAGPVELTFDPSLPCPLRVDAVTYVVGP